MSLITGKKGFIFLIIDYATTFVFTFEMAMKIIAHGFIINGRNSYIYNLWNIIGIIKI